MLPSAVVYTEEMKVRTTQRICFCVLPHPLPWTARRYRLTVLASPIRLAPSSRVQLASNGRTPAFHGPHPHVQQCDCLRV